MAQQISNDAREQALSYVRHQAAKSLSELAAAMERTGEDCARCLAGVSEAQAGFKHDEEWSMREIVDHMISSSRGVNEEITGLAKGVESTRQARAGLTGESDRGIEEMRRGLAELWSETGALVGSLGEDGDMEKTWDHPFFGALNFREWIAFQRLHALDHVQQMEKLKAHPEYPKASGQG